MRWKTVWNLVSFAEELSSYSALQPVQTLHQWQRSCTLMNLNGLRYTFRDWREVNDLFDRNSRYPLVQERFAIGR